MGIHHFSAAVRDELALALNAYMASERASDVLRLVNATNHIAREAHQLSLSPEAMLIALKDLYAELPSGSPSTDQVKRRKAFDVFVSRSIEAYFEPEKPDPAT